MILKEMADRDLISGERASEGWDAVGIDNNLLMKELVSQRLHPTGPTDSWKIDGVEISARMVSSSVATKAKYRFVFLGPQWRADFDAVFGSDLKLDKMKSHILWTMYRNVRPLDSGGAICRHELNEWLVSVLSDDETP